MHKFMMFLYRQKTLPTMILILSLVQQQLDIWFQQNQQFGLLDLIMAMSMSPSHGSDGSLG
jgi:hypothetical protein